LYLKTVSIAGVCLLLAVSVSSLNSKHEDVVAVLTQLEHDAAAADLAGDAAFYEKSLAEDWTDGMSNGQFQNKQELVADLRDKARNITLHETLSDIRVRLYGDTAITTYTETYDALIKGERRARTIITTNTYVKQGGQWKQVAAHSSAVAQP